MVISSHNGVAAKTLDCMANALIVCGDENTIHAPSLFNTPVDVLYQRLAFDLNQWFSGEAGGTVSCGDDCNCGFRLYEHRNSS
jgi:hypothetical protein